MTELIESGAVPGAVRGADVGIAFLKGHGTENDFVLLPDRSGSLTITPEMVRALCDRRAGIGGDGLIRVAPDLDGTGFFMDYWNADGSLAEMCGNGARVFAKFLYDAGWVGAGPFTFSTRGGPRRARMEPDGQICIEMGPVTIGPVGQTTVRMTDGEWRTLPGTAVDVGNPHLVVLTQIGLENFDLTVAPRFDAVQFPDGVNIEFVNVRVADDIAMRVFERGSGETRSCGTGTVAAAAAHLKAAHRGGGTTAVRVPGGRVQVTVDTGGSTLTGPAVIVGSGVIDHEWWSQQQK